MNDTAWFLRAAWLWKASLGAALGLALVIPTLFLAHAFAENPNQSQFTRSDQTNSQVSVGTVQSIIDGDTLVLSIAGQSERVRLVGIDTPESVSTSTPQQCFGAEATQALKGLVAPGDAVQIASDTERRDRYGRLLLYVHTADDIFVNQWLVQAGFADVMFFEPNTSLRPALTAARNQAKSANVGLWGQCDGPDQPLS